MDLGLSGKRALVTGSSRGLGFAVAKELLAAGADVVICGRNADSLARAKAQLDATGAGTEQKVVTVTADINTPDGIDHVLTMADAHLSGIDILCMSTGGPAPGNFKDLDADAFTRSANDLIESLVRLIKGALPTMQASGWGRVLAVTSISAAQPVDNLILSNTMRAGIHGLMKSLANEYGPDGITFNCLMPGFTNTERMKSVLDASAKARGVSYAEAVAGITADVPMRRMGQPEDFAALAAFLASERAGYITGCSIPVDGGWIKGL